MDIANLSANLELHEPGLWVAKTTAAVSYPEDANAWCYQIEDRSFWFRHRNRAIQSVVAAFPPAGPIFDIGGGNGYVALGLRQAGFESVLVEPGMHGCANARARGLEPVICATLEQAGFPAETLPAAGIFDVLEHIEQDTAFLATLNRLLVPGGRLYLTTPAYGWLWSQEDRDAGHFRRYTLASLGRRLAQTGYKVELATYLFGFLPLPLLLLRTLPYRLGLSKPIDIEREKRRHLSPPGPLGRLVERALAAEARHIGRAGRLPFGGSCLVVATKL